MNGMYAKPVCPAPSMQRALKDQVVALLMTLLTSLASVSSSPTTRATKQTLNIEGTSTQSTLASLAELFRLIEKCLSERCQLLVLRYGQNRFKHKENGHFKQYLLA